MRPNLEINTDLANAEAVLISLMHGRMDLVKRIVSNKSNEEIMSLLKTCRFCIIGPTQQKEYGILIWTRRSLLYVDIEQSVMVEFKVYDTMCPHNIETTPAYETAIEMMDAMNFGEIDKYYIQSCNYNTKAVSSIASMKSILKNHSAKLLVPAHDNAEEGYMIISMAGDNCFIGNPSTDTLHEVTMRKPNRNYVPVI